MRALLNDTTRVLAGATVALALLVTPACDDDDPVEPPVATMMTIEEGNNQNVVVSTASEPLVVQVLDQFDDPMVGVTVTWTVASGDGTLSVASSQTDANGEAEVIFTAGATTGAATVTASASGLTSVTFSLMVDPQQ